MNEKLVIVLDDFSDTRKSFEGAKAQVATALMLLVVTASEAAKNTAAMARNASNAAMIVKHGAEESEKDLIYTSHSPPTSCSDSSFDKARKSRKDRSTKQKPSRCK